GQLCLDVLEVNVDRHRADLEGGELRFQVLGPVVAEDGHLGAGADARRVERGGEARGALLVDGEGVFQRTVDESRPGRGTLRQSFPEGREVQVTRVHVRLGAGSGAGRRALQYHTVRPGVCKTSAGLPGGNGAMA